MATLTIDRLEKTSSLVRNIVLLLGAIVTASVFIADRWKDPLLVRAHTVYLYSSSSQQEMMLLPPSQSTNKTPSPLGSLSDIWLENTTKLPMSIQVRIPRYDSLETDRNSKWPIFSIAAAIPQCSLLPNEIEITNNGYIPATTVGTLTIAKFPPGCTLYLEIASTRLSYSTLIMNDRLEVFSDGKLVPVKRAFRLYGWMGLYASRIEDGGPSGIFLFLILPIVFLLGMLTMLVQAIVKRDTAVQHEGMQSFPVTPGDKGPA